MSRSRKIEAEAASWLARKHGSGWSTDDQQELDLWLGESFSNKAAYWRLEEGWRQADRVAALGMSPQYEGGLFFRLEKSWKPVALAASLALAGYVGMTQLGSITEPPSAKGQQITTELGARKLVELPDGSNIELNTATMVRAAITSKNREIWLEKGEAFFDVRHSKSMPFVVHAGPRTITVLGTKFSVRRDADKVTVAVLSGRVKLTRSGDLEDSGTMQVAAGSIAVTEPNAAIVTEGTSEAVQAELAWREGQLVFRNDTLAEAAAEFNRYNRRKLVVTGKAAQLKIGGSFKASNVDGFVRLLRDAYGLNVASNDSEVRVTD